MFASNRLLVYSLIPALLLSGLSAHARARVVSAKNFKAVKSVPSYQVAQQEVDNPVTNRTSLSAKTLENKLEEDKRDRSLSFKLDVGTSRGLDQYADTWDLGTDISASYKLSDQQSVGAKISYLTILSQPDGGLGNASSSTPERYGIGDLTFTHGFTKLWSNEDNQLNWSNGLTIGTSEMSRRSSLLAGISTGFEMQHTRTSWLKIAPSVGFYYRQYEYDDADLAGSEVNSPFGLSYALRSEFSFTDWLGLTLKYGQVQRLDYENRWEVIQSASASLGVQASDNLSMFVGYSWRDQMVTNDPLFATDKLSFNAGLSASY